MAANFRLCGGLGFHLAGRVSGAGEGERCIILQGAVFVAGETVSPFPVLRISRIGKMERCFFLLVKWIKTSRHIQHPNIYNIFKRFLMFSNQFCTLSLYWMM